MFDINTANVPTKCDGLGCNKVIPAKTPKFRFHNQLGAASTSKSLCKECVIKLVIQLFGHNCNDLENFVNYLVGLSKLPDDLEALENMLQYPQTFGIVPETENGQRLYSEIERRVDEIKSAGQEFKKLSKTYRIKEAKR